MLERSEGRLKVLRGLVEINEVSHAGGDPLLAIDGPFTIDFLIDCLEYRFEDNRWSNCIVFAIRSSEREQLGAKDCHASEPGDDCGHEGIIFYDWKDATCVSSKDRKSRQGD